LPPIIRTAFFAISHAAVFTSMKCGHSPAAQEKNVTPENQARGAIGDSWLWTAIDAGTKLVATWTVGDRNAPTAHMHMLDLASRVRSRAQLTSDGHGALPPRRGGRIRKRY
jgi:transposase-like protein